MKTSLTFKFVTLAKKMGISSNPLASQKVKEMRQEIDSVSADGGIKFEIGMYPDGSWSARSTNVDGIISGGFDQSEIPAMIKDAIFTYYDIPPQYCDDTLLKGTGEKKTVKNELLVTAQNVKAFIMISLTNLKQKDWVKACKKLNLVVDKKKGKGSHYRIINPDTNQATTCPQNVTNT